MLIPYLAVGILIFKGVQGQGQGAKAHFWTCLTEIESKDKI